VRKQTIKQYGQRRTCNIITRKLMVKQNGLTNRSNNTFACSATTTKTTGMSFYH
jgi:hypothetical protein